jgi:hypothetical protein
MLQGRSDLREEGGGNKWESKGGVEEGGKEGEDRGGRGTREE